VIFSWLFLAEYPVCTRPTDLLVEGLGVGGGGRDVGVTGSLVGAGGELELVGRLQVGIAGGAVGGGVVLEVEEKGEHVDGEESSTDLFIGGRERELALPFWRKFLLSPRRYKFSTKLLVPPEIPKKG